MEQMWRGRDASRKFFKRWCVCVDGIAGDGVILSIYGAPKILIRIRR